MLRFLIASLVLSCVLLFWWFHDYSMMVENLIIGVVSSTILLIAVEVRDLLLDKRDFGGLAGIYKRTGFFNADDSRTSDTKYVLSHDHDGVDPTVLLSYHRRRHYTCTVHYGGGTVNAAFYLDQLNRHIATGSYQYLNNADLGIYMLYVDQTNPKRLFVFHKNVLPSGFANGYEIWEKQ